MLTERGAGVVSVVVPDRNGIMGDVVLGYRDEESYLADGPCAGKIPGRFANRIDGGRFVLDGKEHLLVRNNPGYQLHGGPDGFSNRLWKTAGISDTEAVLTLDSPDGDQGYPGNMHVEAVYTWRDDNSLTLSLKATTDAPTIINLTNHTYWNLDGEDSGSVLGHTLKLNASRWLVTTDALIPTGELASVDGTPMDFRTAKPIGRDIKADFPALKYGKGYDNCWVLDGAPGLKLAAELSSAVSGRSAGLHRQLAGWITRKQVRPSLPRLRRRGHRVPGLPRRAQPPGIPLLCPATRRDLFPNDNLQTERIK